MAEAYICLGSNLGDKRATIARALDLLAGAMDVAVKARSGDYRTPPWGKLDQDWFVNACARVETALAPEALLAQCLTVERQLGRERLERWGPRVIDIDLLTYDDRAIATASLTLPHPHLTQRAFVLVPLAEIAPTLVIGGRPVADWLAEVDIAGIERMTP
ncbi:MULTISPECIES: 2-amino-4-hydroxy-6-hydroxymethyldihydropteridine diphosphokinase [unclassified Chelatococcus]|uniref:2-amino-4-hydroxy-6- hydroxymethyldihydropteridine diphosphokinase n=1 Tax=unclassified Chelatococcus TaxID=2638111 RepID=UPI001BCEB731|nr:2-amino-4-hydroxy-6-hydroxymethyldihydropteridine diphosphokinase [Chelatococcus sp.]MBS7697993.1 2-amino-4-hydroxy-6-hydroxymethyldihydropteridine diphosphokinase [Chelatococcus sp. YT9]MBX3556689.1 2-amino-4-hydroxy-6-hydroxymethyldihydropteridine diphosphokinase [Chelatococcus sp.]